MKAKFNVWLLVVCFLVIAFVAFTGSLLTSNTKTDWYQEIKPSITPPDFAFPIAWTILFILIALSMYLVFNKSKNKKLTALIYGINLDLNMLWSLLFFALKNPFAGFFCIILLIISIVLMIFHAWKIDKSAAWMLVPYLLWVLFASILNFLAI